MTTDIPIPPRTVESLEAERRFAEARLADVLTAEKAKAVIARVDEDLAALRNGRLSPIGP